MKDNFGNEIHVGDRVMVTHVDADVGAYLYRTGTLGHTVVGLGRTRARLQSPNFTGSFTVGASALRVVEAVDGRTLRTADEVWAEHQSKQHSA